MTSGAHQTESIDGSTICMLTKFDPEGEVVWSTFYGGQGVRTNGISIDANNNIYLAGFTGSTTGIATPGAFQPTIVTNENGENYPNGFIAKFNANGVLQWGTYFPNSIFVITADAQGNIYVAGKTFRTTGISTSGTFQTSYLYPIDENSNFSSNSFLNKFDTHGNREWGTYYGFAGTIGVGVDEFGSVYMAGQATEEGTGFFATPNSHQSQQGSGFLTKFNDIGNRVWSTYYGNPNTAQESTVIYDLQVYKNEIYLGGITSSTDNIASSGAHQTILAGSIDTFLAKFDIYGQREWGTYYGGEDIDFDNIFAYSGKMISFLDNHIYFTSSTQSTTGIATAGAFKETYNANGFTDNFIAKFTKQGERVWGTYYGGDKIESASGVLPIGDDAFYIYGTTGSSNGIATNNAYQPSLERNFNTDYNVFNAYLVKFEPSLGLDSFKDTQVLLYPNPNDGEFTIGAVQEANLKLYNLHGQLVHEVVSQPGDNELRVDARHLSAGIYFAVVGNKEGELKTIKVVIE
ncbi:T9SS type A sorting domain-containing protein [Mesonia sp.]|uniref:T9SS type A sorting domain-containing protein n=1 Tax=Mesonia sp. TaxID=1960830 RepID=UPI003F98F8A8